MGTPYKEIRADYDRDTLVVYQSYRPEIADAAVKAQRFVPPFSFGRMTWIKPSFLWMMERCGWARKAGQERVLAIRIRRSAWEGALGEAELTSPSEGVYRDADEWRNRFEKARVHVLWERERSLQGAKLNHRSIQVGLSRHIVEDYNEWITEIRDLTPLVRKLHDSRDPRPLPAERPYPTPPEIARRLGM